MKRQILLAIFLPAASFAQSPSPATSASPSSAPVVLQRASSAPLTAGERGTLVAAGKKALQDPNVQAAAAKLHEAKQALDNAMIAKDKTLKPILDKIAAAALPGAPHTRLTAAELAQVRAARDSMKDSPEAAAWRAATADYRAAVHQAIISADPSAAAILNKTPRPLASAVRPSVSPSVAPRQ